MLFQTLILLVGAIFAFPVSGQSRQAQPILSSRGESCQMNVLAEFLPEIRKSGRRYLWSGVCRSGERSGPGVFVVVEQNPPKIVSVSRRLDSSVRGFTLEEIRVSQKGNAFQVEHVRNIPVQNGYRPTVERKSLVPFDKTPLWAQPILLLSARELESRWQEVGNQSHRLAAFAGEAKTTTESAKPESMRIPQTAAPNTPSPQAGAEVSIERRIFGPGIGSPGGEIYYLYIGQDGPDHTAGSDRKERVSGAGCSAGRGGWAALVNSHARNGSSYTVTAYGWACGAATREQAIQAAYEQCRQKSGCDFSKTTLNRTMEIMSAFSSSNRAQQQYLVCDIRSPVEGQRTAPFWTEQASSARSSLCESFEPRGLP